MNRQNFNRDDLGFNDDSLFDGLSGEKLFNEVKKSLTGLNVIWSNEHMTTMTDAEIHEVSGWIVEDIEAARNDDIWEE